MTAAPPMASLDQSFQQGADGAPGPCASLRLCCRRVCCHRRREAPSSPALHRGDFSESFLSQGTTFVSNSLPPQGTSSASGDSPRRRPTESPWRPTESPPHSISTQSEVSALGASLPSVGEVAGGFFVGQKVHAWSKAKKMWFNDGIVDEVATSVLKEKFQDQVRKVLPGSVKVRFDGRVKWLPAAQAEDELRKVDDCVRYGWREMRPHDTLPDKVVKSGSTPTDGDVYVACNQTGEPGKLSLEPAEEGALKMDKIWCPEGNDTEHGQVLVLGQRHVARWAAVCAGDPLPTGAVPARAAPEGQQVFVARLGEEAGKLSAAGGCVQEVRSHHGGSSAEGEVLVVEEVASELEVEILSAMELQSPGYRFGDVMRKGFHWMRGESSLAPYVKVVFGDQTWRSSCRRQQGGEHFFGERAFFPVPLGEAPPSCLTFKAKDERFLRQVVGVVGDPTIGSGSIEAAGLDITEAQVVELLRGGSSQGRLRVRLRWHGGRPGGP